MRGRRNAMMTATTSGGTVLVVSDGHVNAGISDPGQLAGVATKAYADGVVSRLYRGLTGLVKGRGITVVQGSGRLTGPRTVEVDGGAAEVWADEVAAEHGFTEVSHTIEIFGLCGPCAVS